VAGQRLPYDDIDTLRLKITEDAPHFAIRDEPPQSPGADPVIWNAIGTPGTVEPKLALESPIADFYLTNPIARASETMAECSRLFVRRTSMAAE
jgi:NADH-quinone oxidoreductase subunit G